MRYQAFAAVLLGAVAASDKIVRHVDHSTPCERGPVAPIEEFIREPLVHAAELPEQFVWDDVDGINYLTNMRN